MSAAATSNIDDFKRRELTFRGKTKTVLTIGGVGPAVIVLPEVFGIAPTLIRFCRWVRDAGFRVYVPAILGKPTPPTRKRRRALSTIVKLCVSREFYLFAANRSSPIVDWLRGWRIPRTENAAARVSVSSACV